MKQLAIAKDLSLPIEFVTQKAAFLGRTGSGKTYAATKAAELMLDAGAQVIAIDPVGVWWGLRLEADGKTPSSFDLPVFGGLHGDIPIEPTSGVLLADLVVDRGISAVLDVSQLESDKAKNRFASDFADRFFSRKKAAPSAVHLYVEECQEFVPQNPGRDENDMLHYFNRMIKLGRNFGIGVSLISQRPQEVNKKALNQTELMLAFQMTGPQERKAISLWVSEKGAEEDVADILPKLQVGECHVWSPQWLQISRTVKIAPKRTFNASSTPTVGGKAVEARPLGAIDLEKLQKAMASTIERAKDTDPKALRAEIARLKRELVAKPRQNGAAAKPVDREQLQRLVDVSVRKATDAFERQDRQFRTGLKREIDRLQRQFEPIATTIAALSSAVAAEFKPAADTQPVQVERVVTRTANRVQSPEPSPTLRLTTPAERESLRLMPGEIRSTGAISGAKQKILNAIATLNHLGVDRPSLVQVALFVGVSHTTGSYQQNVRDLEVAELVARDRGHVTLTGYGRTYGIPDASRDPIEYWKQKLPGAQAKLLERILDRYPELISREELAQQVGVSHTTGSFQQNLRDMRTYGIIEMHAGQAVASELLFP